MTQTKQNITEWRKENLGKLSEQRDEIDKVLKEKNYVLTVYETGHNFGSSPKGEDRKICPRRYWVMCSLEEIPKYIEYMKQPFWRHPDISNPKVKNKDIPFEEKEWGINYDLVIEPCSEKLEKSYLDGSKKGFFKIQRELEKQKQEKETTNE